MQFKTKKKKILHGFCNPIHYQSRFHLIGPKTKRILKITLGGKLLSMTMVLCYLFRGVVVFSWIELDFFPLLFLFLSSSHFFPFFLLFFFWRGEEKRGDNIFFLVSS